MLDPTNAPFSHSEQEGRDRLVLVTERFRDQLRNEGYSGDLSAVRLNDETFDHIANRFSMAMDERDIHLAELDVTAALQAIALQYRSESSGPNVDRSPSETESASASASASDPDLAPFVRQAYRSATYDDPASEASIALRHPFMLDGQRYERIDLQPPAFGDVQAVHRGEISMLDLYARMAGVTVDVLEALRWDDSERVAVNAQLLAPRMVKA